MHVASGGGTYGFDGKTYIERLEFGSEALLLDLVGQDQVFAVTLDGDEWHHTGTQRRSRMQVAPRQSA